MKTVLLRLTFVQHFLLMYGNGSDPWSSQFQSYDHPEGLTVDVVGVPAVVTN